MRSRSESALAQLVETARALPGRAAERKEVGAGPVLPAGATATAAVTTAMAGGEAAALRGAVGSFLAALAARVEPALEAALGRAGRAWDQVDDLTVLDEALEVERRTLVARLEAVKERDPGLYLEATLTLGAVLDLVRLCERRLATLVRLRLRSAEPELWPRGRPFLDLGAALAETARRWR